MPKELLPIVDKPLVQYAVKEAIAAGIHTFQAHLREVWSLTQPSKPQSQIRSLDVIEGTAKVTIDNEVKLVFEGQSVYVTLGAIHRMENPSKLLMLLIEVQIGKYLGEDDTIRYDDLCSRI